MEELVRLKIVLVIFTVYLDLDMSFFKLASTICPRPRAKLLATSTI
jgi:hypothetical protein